MSIDKTGLVDRINQRMGGRVERSDIERVLDCLLEEIVTALKDGASVHLPSYPDGGSGQLSTRDKSAKGSLESSKIERHIKTEPLAERLGIAPETLRRAAHRGELRPFRIGRDMLWREQEVLAWLESLREPEKT